MSKELEKITGQIILSKSHYASTRQSLRDLEMTMHAHGLDTEYMAKTAIVKDILSEVVKDVVLDKKVSDDKRYDIYRLDLYVFTNKTLKCGIDAVIRELTMEQILKIKGL